MRLRSEYNYIAILSIDTLLNKRSTCPFGGQ